MRIFLLITLLTSTLVSKEIISIYAVNTKTGQVLIDENSNLSLQPSSCLKIVTTAAALHLLGENNRFETNLEYDGTINSKGELKGNLYIRGGGDPCLGSNRIAGSLDWQELLNNWLSAIKTAGIHTIEGVIIADATKWETLRAVPSWEWEDLGNYYGTGASALSFHENYYNLTFQPGKTQGAPTQILYTEPPLRSLLLENEVTTGAEGSGDQACVYGSELSSVQQVRGTIPTAVETFTIKGAIPDPAVLVAELLTQKLIDQGISIKNKTKKPKEQRTLIQRFPSPTIQDIVHQTNKKSINLYAEHLLKKMGEETFKEGSTNAGLKAVAEFLKNQGIDLEGLHMVDGSGLSRKNLITTKQLVSLLVQMKKSPLFPSFFASLPEAKEGIHAKPGSMSLVKGYTGYVGEIAFAILINNCPNRDIANQKIQEVFTRLKNF